MNTNSVILNLLKAERHKAISMPYILFFPVIPLLIIAMIGVQYLYERYPIPENIPGWIFLFGLPHIVSSFQTAMDKEYLISYKRQSLVVSLILLFPLIYYFVGLSLKFLLVLYFILTINHVVAQQYGISIALSKMRPSRTIKLCQYLTLIIGSVAYLEAYFSIDLINIHVYKIIFFLTGKLFFPIMISILLLGFYSVWQFRNRRVAVIYYTLNNIVFLLSLYLIFKTDYLLIGLMLIRVLHDSTAFIIYIFHDVTRNYYQRNNFLYNKFSAIPIVFMNPLLAIIIAGILSYLAIHVEAIVYVIMGLTLGHYYNESATWKNGTPHRAHLHF